MGELIKRLKRDEEQERKRIVEQERQLRADRLIAAAVPCVWQAFSERIAKDAKSLSKQFPDRPELQLQFEVIDEDHFTVSNASLHKSVTAHCAPSIRAIELEFRTRADIYSPVQTYSERIGLFVNLMDAVGAEFCGRKSFEEIAEIVLKRLL